MKLFNWGKLTQKAINFLIIQLFLTLISLPILVAWGLPLSLLSPIGNLIFSPFLTIFLLLSSIIFFTEMLCIPNRIFIWLLEHVTTVWQYFLSFSSQSAMYAFKKPPLLLLVLIPVITLFLIRHPLMHAPRNRLAGLCAMSFITWTILSFSSLETNWVKKVPCNNGFVTLLYQNNKIILLDPGVIGRRISAPSWISYTLIPEITKLTGSLTLDCMICSKLGKVQFDALQTLASKMNIKKLYLPAFEGDLEPHIKRAFNCFYATARGSGTQIIRTYKKPIEIKSETLAITITPEDKQTYRTISYTKPIITGLIDNEPIPIYDFQKSKSIIKE